MKTEEIRAKFEQYWISQNDFPSLDFAKNCGQLEARGDAEYEDMYQNWEFNAFKAAWQHRQSEIDKLKSEIVDLKNSLCECEQGNENDNG